MAVWGLDVAQVRALAKAMTTQANYITNTLIPTVNRVLAGTQWVGPDATQFRNDWSGPLSTHLRNVATELTRYAGIANRDADAQEQISNRVGG